MNFKVFGDKDRFKMVLIHGVLTPWQIWTAQIDILRNKYCVIVPVLNGHEEEQRSEYHSLENEAEQIEKFCITNYGNEILAVCGISMGGAIAYKLCENSKLNISKLVMDGAPLVPYASFLTNMMIKEYLKIIHKSKARDPKTLNNFKENFLPEQYLDSYLKIADNMSDETVKNMVKSISKNQISYNIKNDGSNILYIHGSKANEILSIKSAKLLRKHYPRTSIIVCKGYSHCQKAIYEPGEWTDMIENYISN